MKKFQLNRKTFAFLFALAIFAFAIGSRPAGAQDIDPETEQEAREAYYKWFEAEFQAAVSEDLERNQEALSAAPCVGGFAEIYPCENIDLLAFLPHADMGGSAGNDIWGWTDSLDGKEYALVGKDNGTAFVDISDPENPVYLGRLPSHNNSFSGWRDIKVYADHAFIVSEASLHGVQVFDLTRLRGVANPPVTFNHDARYDLIGSAHNIVINEDTGYAYTVGSAGAISCTGGLHMIDISNPLSPTHAGCFSADGYTHDAQCVLYNGPDTDHQGKEICFAYNTDTVTIVDVTDKANPVQLSRNGYGGSGYTHQGWITEDQTYLLMNDELDESSFGHNTRTRVWDISDLDQPVLNGFNDGPNASIDHNLYTVGNLAYESNYTSGLQVYNLVDLGPSPTLELVGFFDTYVPNNNVGFSGSWSNYPYFPSGVVIVASSGEGLFILQPNFTPELTMDIYLPLVIKDN